MNLGFARRFRGLRRWWWRRCILSNRHRHRQLQLGDGLVLDAPVRADGKGSLLIGKNNRLGFYLSPRVGDGTILLQARSREAELVIGDDNVFSNNVTIIANRGVRIGNHCHIGDQVVIYDSDFHEISPLTRDRSAGQIAAVDLGDRVMLCTRVMVLKGVSIGDNTVVAAGSIVTRSLPANCIAAGVPAKVIRALTAEELRGEVAQPPA